MSEIVSIQQAKNEAFAMVEVLHSIGQASDAMGQQLSSVFVGFAASLQQTSTTLRMVGDEYQALGTADMSGTIAQIDAGTAALKNHTKAQQESNAEAGKADKKGGKGNQSGLETTAKTTEMIGKSLTMMASATEGTTSSVLALAGQVLTLSQGFITAAVSAGTMGAAINASLGIIGVVAMAIMGIVNIFSQSNKEAQEDARKNAEAYSFVDKDLAKAKNYIRVLDDEKSSLDDVADAREALADTFENSIIGYTEENKAILTTVENLQDEYKWRKKLKDLDTEVTAQGYDETTKEVGEAAQKYINARKKVEEEGPDSSNFTKNKQKLAEAEKEFYDSMDLQKKQMMAIMQSLFGDEIAASMIGPINRMWDGIAKALETAESGDVITAMLERARTIPDMIAIALEQSGAQLSPEAIGAMLTGAIAEGDVMTLKDANGKISLYLDFEAQLEDEDLGEKVKAFRWSIIEQLANGEDVEQQDITLANTIFGDMEAEEAAILERVMMLKETVGLEGADLQDQFEFEGKRDEGLAALEEAKKKLEDSKNRKKNAGADYRGEEKAIELIEQQKKELEGITPYYKKHNKIVEEAREAAEDFAKGGESATKRLVDMKGQMKDLGQQRAAIEIIKKGQDNTQEYADAMDYLSKKLNLDPSQILSSLGILDENLGMAEGGFASLLNTIAASNGVTFEIQDGQIVAVGNSANEASMKIAEMMNNLLASDGASLGLELKDGQLAVSGNVPKFERPKGGGTGGGARKGGGGGGQKKNEALDREMQKLEQKKALDQLTTQEEIDGLERILRKYAKTSEEKEDITKKLYDLRKQKIKEDLEYQKAMDQLTLREELAAIDAQIAGYKAGVQARRELEKERYALAKELQRQEYDLKVYYGQLTLAQQEQQLRLMINDYKKGTQARIDLEKELYDMQQQIRDNSISRIDSVADGVISALENRYAEQQRIETERLSESKDNWQKWGDEQVDAIQKQIDALDEMTKEEDRAEEERKKRRQIASLEQQLLYETDLYNQKKLQEQLQNAQKDLDDWLKDKEREDLKAALQAQIDEINDRVEAEQEKLDEQLEANDKYYEELTKEQKLQAEAQKLIMSGSQNELLDLLKNFAPEYNLTGQSLGEQLVDGFTSKVKDVEQWFQSFSGKMSAYQKQMAEVATRAANEFYQTHGIAGGLQPGAEATGAVAVSGPQITMIFNQPVESPTEIRREMERLAEQLANL